jgi:RNA polymerase sigma-70 factor (ECF subfamily)
MPDLESFQQQRPLLFSIAYRMLGSASEAEDVLQDAWLRLSASNTDIRSPQAFAATVVTRLCLDRLKSARATREEYVGPWLPEPVLTDEGPETRAQRSESVTLAFLVLLETLSPEERAVFLLKEVFDYEHAQIAEMLGTTPSNSRQLFHRAKERVRLKPDPAPARISRSIAEQFARAFQAGDTDRLRAMLAADVSFTSDGGGKVSAARRPLNGREEVAHLLAGFRRTAITQGIAGRASLSITEVNAEPAMILRMDGQVDGVWVLSVDEADTITGIRVVRNPDKLAYIARQLSQHH